MYTTKTYVTKTTSSTIPSSVEQFDKSFLVPISIDIEHNTPVFLVDTSGSTGSSLSDSYISQSPKKDTYRVLDYEIELIGVIAKNRGFNKAHIVLWSNNAFLFSNADLSKNELDGTLEHLKLQADQNMSGTHLMCGLKKLDKSMFDPNKITDLIIITDGEIQDSEKTIAQELRSICSNKISLSIVAVERGVKNYLDANANCEVGNALYSIIRNLNLTRFVNKFSIFNARKVEFVDFTNPIVPESYVPYGEHMFARSDFKEFVKLINHELNELASREKLLEIDILRHAHRLSLTIYHYIKNTDVLSTKGIVELFCKMYERFNNRIDLVTDGDDNTVFEKVRKLLISEVDNHVAGRSTTFTSAKKERSRKVEDTNLSLMTDVSKAVSGNDSINESSIFYSALVKGAKESKLLEVKSTQFTNYSVGKTEFKNGCIRIGKYDVPLLFPIDDNSSQAANQWIRTIYSRTLNISPSNPFIFYYLMMDCMIIRNVSNNEALVKLYESYLMTFLNEQVFDTNRKFIDTIVYNEKVKLKYPIIKGAQLYSGLNLNPLTLFYLAILTYVLPYFRTRNNDEIEKRSRFIKGIRSMCAKHIFLDLNPEINKEDYLEIPSSALVNEVVWNSAKNRIEQMIMTDTKIEITSIIGTNLVRMKEHGFNGTPVICPSRSITFNDTVSNDDVTITCDICGSEQSLVYTAKTNESDLKLEEKKLSELTTFLEWMNPIIDSELRINLGLLTGENTDTELISPENFESKIEFVQMDNIMITDPISSSKMRVTTQKEFRAGAYGKYPFLKGLKFDNVALAGGFCRSILLKQEMKDFDFFFYGLDSDEALESRFQEFVVDLVNAVRKNYHLQKQNVKFCGLFKPTFNVFELICFTDPTNHIDHAFTLKNFHENKFMSLRRFNGDIDLVGAHDTQFVEVIDGIQNNVIAVANGDSDTDENSDNDSDNGSDYDSNNESDDEFDNEIPKKKSSTYFEDNDSKGIRMLHRFQFILCKYDSKFAITQSFDMFPSKTVFDNDRVYFTQKSLLAHQYMMNEIMLDGGSDLFKHRISKYFKYGYSIVFPPNTRNWYDDDHQNTYNYVDSGYQGCDENRGPISFEVRRIIDNQIIISHNSNIEKMLEKNEELEQNALDEAKALYVSNLFCSFVSILRYVEINGIDYIFPKLKEIKLDDSVEITEDLLEPISATDLGFVDDNHKSRIKFQDRTLDIKFMPRFNTLYSDRSWFDQFYKSMLLNDANDFVLDLNKNFSYKGGNSK